MPEEEENDLEPLVEETEKTPRKKKRSESKAKQRARSIMMSQGKSSSAVTVTDQKPKWIRLQKIV